MEPKHTTPRADYEWSEEHAQAAAKAFAFGSSADEIANELGCTRNAVIGKMYRMGIVSPTKHGGNGRPRAELPAPRPPKARPNMQTIRATRRNPIQPQGPLLPVERHTPRQYVAPVASRKTFQGLKARDCRWPCGNPGEPDFFFCGAPQVDGASYCLGHCRVAYQPASGRR